MSLFPEQMDQPARSNQPSIVGVSELSRDISQQVEGTFPVIRLRGEISNYSVAASGHAYFRLKEGNDVIDAVAWRNTVHRFSLQPEDGIEVVCRGRITTYSGRSTYQIMVQDMDLSGQGALHALLRRRREKLQAEGLFDSAGKRELPFLPSVIAIVTADGSAACQDILHRIHDRCPRHVLIWPVPVQGKDAPGRIAAAIADISHRAVSGPEPRPDVLILARGGGSFEDLFAFNEEIVVRAVSESSIPVITGIGHETDDSLADLAADKRAATPTAAAEYAVPVRAELLDEIAQQGVRLARLHRQRITTCQGQLMQAAYGLDTIPRAIDIFRNQVTERGRDLRYAIARLHNPWRDAVAGLRPPHPRRTLGYIRERLTLWQGRLSQCCKTTIKQNHLRLPKLPHPALRLAAARQRLVDAACMDEMARRIIRPRSAELGKLSALCAANSPLRPLSRGFALIQDRQEQPILSASALVQEADFLITFHDGTVRARSRGRVS